ncbi:MAG: ATP-grasp domain-containing protein [Phycisphaeraceae bacterium]
MNILVLEHITAGGMGGEPVPVALADAGMAMWKAVVEDFSAAGHQVRTIAGERADVPGQPRCVSITPTVPYAETIERMAKDSQAALIIAPESGGILASYEETLRKWGVRSLGSDPKAIALCGDKFLLGDHWMKAGFSSPMTGTAPTPGVVLEAVKEKMLVNLTTWIFKPRDGAGCEHNYLAHTLKDLEELETKLSPETKWVAQHYFPGMPASVSFIVHEGKPRPLLAGRQFIQGNDQLRYAGGKLPLDRDLAERAIALATRAIRTIAGLTGFVGVDLILGAAPKDDTVIEVNPRLTFSYCGLRKLCKTNLAAALLDPAAPIEWNTGSVSFNAAGVATKDGWA